MVSLGQTGGPGWVGTPVGWLWVVSCWGQHEEGGEKAGHNRGHVPGAGHTMGQSLPKHTSSLGHVQEVFSLLQWTL